jgi:hypothetical protein
MTVARFKADYFIWLYRYAHETKGTEECLRLLKVWKEWQGEDSLHEMAYGEPITAAEIAERNQLLIDKLRRIEAELAWLSTLGPDQPAGGTGVSAH